MAGGESSYEDISLDTGYDVVCSLTVHDFQDILIANANSGQFNSGIIEDMIEIYRVLILFRLGFVRPFSKFTPETI